MCSPRTISCSFWDPRQGLATRCVAPSAKWRRRERSSFTSCLRGFHEATHILVSGPRVAQGFSIVPVHGLTSHENTHSSRARPCPWPAPGSRLKALAMHQARCHAPCRRASEVVAAATPAAYMGSWRHREVAPQPRASTATTLFLAGFTTQGAPRVPELPGFSRTVPVLFQQGRTRRSQAGVETWGA